MNKENVLYGLIALLAGLILGYVGSNYLNEKYRPVTRATTGSPSSSLPATQAGAASGAQTDFTEVIQTARNEPANFDAQMSAGGMYREIRRFEQALEFYRRAVEAKPTNVEALTKLGDTLFDLQRYAEAEDPYRRALQQSPQNVMVRMDLGLTYFLRQPRDLDRAISEFRGALEIDPRHEKTLQNLTAAQIEKGDVTGARASLRQLIAVNPSNAGIESFQQKLRPVE
jgi:tetratricopeptide (TPR) repeat protein